MKEENRGGKNSKIKNVKQKTLDERSERREVFLMLNVN